MDEQDGSQQQHEHRPWGMRRNGLHVRNADLLIILAVALLAGAGVTYLTAYLGVR